MKYINDSIVDIIEILERENLSNDGTFPFLDLKFIKTNYKILLKYLKITFEKDVIRIGMCLIIIGCSLYLSIFFSLILIAIINNKYNEKKNFDSKIVIIQDNNKNDQDLTNYGPVNTDNIKENENINYPNQNINNKKFMKKIHLSGNDNINSNQSENTYLAFDKSISDIQKSITKSIIEKKIYDLNSYDAETIKLKINLLKKEEAKKDNDKFKINLIFFYEKLTDENVELYNRLKLSILGGFFDVQDADILKKLLSELDKLKTSFILISTGSSFINIKDACRDSNCIKQIYIFCGEVEKYKKLYNSNKKIFEISNDIVKIISFLAVNSELFSDYNKNIKQKIDHNPLISYYEYENY